MMQTLASDNFSPAHPKVLEFLKRANTGQAFAYGDDPWTTQAKQAISKLFEREVTSYFVFNGTAANVLSLLPALSPCSSLLCADTAHIYNDESTAPERFLNARVQPIGTFQGKIIPENLHDVLSKGHGIHYPKPAALTITQPTELGTLYTREEIRALVALAKDHGLFVHVDGARLGTALVAQSTSISQALVEAGVDAVSLGGTKQGMMFGEAVVFIHPKLAESFPYYQKLAMQLSSKMRFIAAQFLALLEDNLWLECARQANHMARYLEKQLEQIEEVNILYPVQTNAVFARIPPELISPLQKEMFFWPWHEQQGIVRWMTSFDTTQETIDRFVSILKRQFRDYKIHCTK